VKALLESEGTDALPAIFIDGNLSLKGAYPNEAEGAAWLSRAGAGLAT
jgi:hypothetical protein